LENVHELKKQTLIKFLIYISLFFVSSIVFGQDSKEDAWKKEKSVIEYKKKKNYKGPKNWNGSSPRSIDGEDVYFDENSTNGSSGSGVSQYSPSQIEQDREKRYGKVESKKGSDLIEDPTVTPPEPIEFPEFESPDLPDIDAPDVPDIDWPVFPKQIWQILLFLIIAFVVVFALYKILKNQKPSAVKTVVDVENEWNPEVVTKSELELKLEESLLKEDYRSCIRIYFTFILKELIKKNWIKWRKEKTNWDYAREMYPQKSSIQFNECVRIYDLVWYGEYTINKDVYELLQPALENYYKSLNPTDD